MRLTMIWLIFFVFVATTQAQSDPLPTDDGRETITSENAASLELVETLDTDMKQVSVSPDGSMIAIASQHQDYDYSILIYEIQSGQQLIAIEGRMDFFRALLWSPDSFRIAVISGRTTGSGVEERSVKLYSMRPDAEPSVYIMGNADVWYTDYVYPEDQPTKDLSIAWSPTSDMLVAAFHERLVILSAIETEELFSAELSDLEVIQWFPNERMIMSQNSDGQIQIWGVPGNE